MLSIIKKILQQSGLYCTSPVNLGILFCYDNFLENKIKDEINYVLFPIFEFIDKSLIPVHLKISGTSLSTLLWYNYKFVEKLVSMVNEQKIELLGSSFSNCALGLLDKDEVFEQITMHKKYLKQIFDKLPKGFIFSQDNITKEVLQFTLDNDYKYFIIHDHYLNQPITIDFIDGINNTKKVNFETISSIIYTPKKVEIENHKFLFFPELTVFNDYFQMSLENNDENIFYQNIQKLMKIMFKFETNTYFIFKFDLSNISNCSKKPLFNLTKISEIILNFLKFISSDKRFKITNCNKWYDTNYESYINFNEITFPSTQLKKYYGYKYNDIFQKISISDTFKKKLETINKYNLKLINAKKFCNSLQRSDKEKICFEAIMELSKVEAMFYKHSFGSPNLLDNNDLLDEKLTNPETLLDLLEIIKSHTKGIYKISPNNKQNEYLLIFNDIIFVILNKNSNILNFIELLKGYEYIGNFKYDCLNSNSDQKFLCGEDYYSILGIENEKKVNYIYQPSSSILIGTQFIHKNSYFEVTKGLSLFNNKLVTNYTIKNLNNTDLKLLWHIKYAFAPDKLSVLKFGRPILAFFTKNQFLEVDKDYKELHDGIGILNKLNNNYIFIEPLRIIPFNYKTFNLLYSFGIIITYEFIFESFEEKHFVIDISC